jgi:hypothetical protein
LQLLDAVPVIQVGLDPWMGCRLVLVREHEVQLDSVRTLGRSVLVHTQDDLATGVQHSHAKPVPQAIRRTEI